MYRIDSNFFGNLNAQANTTLGNLQIVIKQIFQFVRVDINTQPTRTECVAHYSAPENSSSYVFWIKSLSFVMYRVQIFRILKITKANRNVKKT